MWRLSALGGVRLCTSRIRYNVLRTITACDRQLVRQTGAPCPDLMPSIDAILSYLESQEKRRKNTTRFRFLFREPVTHLWRDNPGCG
jgi:hypothetical protein